MKIFFLTHEEDIYTFRYIQAGANGYLNKLIESNTIVNALKAVLEVGNYISVVILDKFISFSENKKEESNLLEELTQREFEFVELLVNGCGNLEIAKELDIKMTTVITNKLNIL